MFCAKKCRQRKGCICGWHRLENPLTSDIEIYSYGRVDMIYKDSTQGKVFAWYAAAVKYSRFTMDASEQHCDM